MASQYIVYFLYNTEKSYTFQGRLQKEVDKEKKIKNTKTQSTTYEVLNLI